jgi:outer membrane protein assembly factor BamE (lipoprotein component of BamABCDE complex)
MSMRMPRHYSLVLPTVAVIVSIGLSGCIGETLNRGYVPSENALQQVQVGAPREQVLIALGTPSTTADFGGEVFYYISQKANRPVAFLNSRVIDQTVLAVYFDENSQVTQIANYGLEDGQIIDMVSRTTPTGGRDFSFLSQIFTATGIGGMQVPSSSGPPGRSGPIGR